MFKLNILKFLSVSLLMCPSLSSAMEPRNDVPETMLLSISNQSEQIVEASILTESALSDNAVITIQPYDDKDNVIFKNDNACILTQLGFFTLAPDNLDHPEYLVLSQHTEGHENQTLIVQEIPYYRSNNITMIVNPDGSVSLAQVNMGYALEKMNIMQQEAERKLQQEPKHHFGFHNPFGHKKEKKDKRKKSVDIKDNDNNVIINQEPVIALEPIEKFAVYSSSSSLEDSSSDERDPHDMLYRGIINDSAEDVTRALQAGIIDLDTYKIKDDKFPIVFAVLLAKPNAVKALLEYGVKPYAYYTGNSLVSSAIMPGKGRGLHLIQHAVLLGDMKSALEIIQRTSYEKNIPFCVCCGDENHGRCMAHHKPILAPILDCFKQDQKTCLKLIQALFDKGYRNDAGDNFNLWRLAICSDQGKCVLNKALLELFLKNGLDPNETIPCSGSCFTPLGYAIQAGDIQVIRLLLDAGANINKQIFSGVRLTPCDYAKRCQSKRLDIIEFLEKHRSTQQKGLEEKAIAYIHDFYSHDQQSSQVLRRLHNPQMQSFYNPVYRVQIRFDKPVSQLVVNKLLRSLRNCVQLIHVNSYMDRKEDANIRVIEFDTFNNQEEFQKIIDQVNAILHDGSF